MPRLRSEAEVEELVELARRYCELRALQAQARAGGELAPEDDALFDRRLRQLDARLKLQNSNNTQERRRAAIIPLFRAERKVAR